MAKRLFDLCGQPEGGEAERGACDSEAKGGREDEGAGREKNIRESQRHDLLRLGGAREVEGEGGGGGGAK